MTVGGQERSPPGRGRGRYGGGHVRELNFMPWDTSFRDFETSSGHGFPTQDTGTPGMRPERRESSEGRGSLRKQFVSPSTKSAAGPQGRYRYQHDCGPGTPAEMVERPLSLQYLCPY
uniref:Uncharacterized protein n=1 Tax=Branchiostoma floridae TaxID=7739 RepID=C3YV05_BRAFL|eukprot:XP_002599856.1 hypothetical protein BRAFLDRAFT_95546 [Branchiostoma floridae]